MNKISPNEEVIKAKYFSVYQDWEVPIPGFLILSPNRKMRSIMDFTDEESEEFIRLMIKTRRGMYKVLNIKEVYFFQNEDSEHGFHLWIFPRFDWMDRFGKKIQSVRPIMEYAKENMINDKDQVREYVAKMREYMKEF